jgi:hypothetical protein
MRVNNWTVGLRFNDYVLTADLRESSMRAQGKVLNGHFLILVRPVVGFRQQTTKLCRFPAIQT